jgi:hypothetical protein
MASYGCQSSSGYPGLADEIIGQTLSHFLKNGLEARPPVEVGYQSLQDSEVGYCG